MRSTKSCEALEIIKLLRVNYYTPQVYRTKVSKSTKHVDATAFAKQTVRVLYVMKRRSGTNQNRQNKRALLTVQSHASTIVTTGRLLSLCSVCLQMPRYPNPILLRV